MDKFSGFNRRIFDFFVDLSKNNSKVWFDDNRNFYETEIKNRSKEFIESMHILFQDSKLDYIADPKVNIFRINRDIRFSADKSPYKTNLGIFFPHRIEVENIKKVASGVYIHFDAEECFVATGMHNPDAKLMKLIRKKIYENWYDFETIITNKKFKSLFPEVYDESNVNKKVLGYDENHPSYNYLKRKSWTYYKTISQEVFYSDELCKLTLEYAKVSREFSIFLNEVLLEL